MCGDLKGVFCRTPLASGLNMLAVINAMDVITGLGACGKDGDPGRRAYLLTFRCSVSGRFGAVGQAG